MFRCAGVIKDMERYSFFLCVRVFLGWAQILQFYRESRLSNAFLKVVMCVDSRHDYPFPKCFKFPVASIILGMINARRRESQSGRYLCSKIEKS